MPDERAVELVHRQIDGEITPAGARELWELRGQDEEVDAFFLDMCAVCEALDAVRLTEPPPRFAEMVATRIHRDRETEPTPVPSQSRRASRRVQFVLAASAAALLAVIVLTPVVIRELDTSNLAGTMSGPPPVAMPVLAQASVAAGELSGTIRVEGRGRELRVTCLLEGAGEGAIEIGYDPRALRVAAGPGLRTTTIGEQQAVVALHAPPWSGSHVGFTRLTTAETIVRVTVEAAGMREEVAIRLAPSDE